MEVLNNENTECNMLDINLVLANFFGILLILMGYKLRDEDTNGIRFGATGLWLEVINMLPVGHMVMAPNELYHQDG